MVDRFELADLENDEKKCEEYENKMENSCKCECCGLWFEGDEFWIDDMRVCEGCYDNAKDEEDKMSNCCNSPILEDTDICDKCKEHCSNQEEQK